MKNIRLTNGQQLHIRKLSEESLEELLSLQDEVIQALEVQSSLQPLSEEEFMHILKGNGLMIGAFHDGKLIAFRAMLQPAIDEEEHLAADAHIPQAEWSSVIYSEISNVHPAFRGHSLQKKLGHLLFDLVDHAAYRYVCATVAPFNIPSLLDKFAQGMQIVALKEKYNGRLRYILYRDFNEVAKEPLERSHVRMDDTLQQQQFLQDGWCGIAVAQEHGVWYVHYVLLG